MRFSRSGLERPNVWPDLAADVFGSLHQYVRVPNESFVVLVFAMTKQGRPDSEIRYTFADDGSDVWFDA